MANSPRFRFRLPHWGWFLLPTIALVVAGIGLSIWLPWHREQQVIRTVEAWGGKVVTETGVGAPAWLQKLAGFDRMDEFKLFDRIVEVNLDGTAVSDLGPFRLAGLTRLRELSVSFTLVTDSGLSDVDRLTNLEWLFVRSTGVTKNRRDEIKKALPSCNIVY